ncbi:MAG: ABC transporter, periplasmic substrate-binding protein [uncultured Thiotrichaceae bacterium]|uniref:ABC transporter, periplasmic substrate-binding protein n=1 Tax=uncultured Thiotrichaceae bacterium TaxID=298394 RepID=A0A6S6U092_9GAMM|nr:MAG: ABC transporter, periplasmic substrate-binding protein [uncultured Thiotrichaceae bacterium]
MKPIFHLTNVKRLHPQAWKSLTSAVMLAVTLVATLSLTPVQAADVEVIEATTISLRGKPHYPPDFKHFDYVNPEAPQGGRLIDWVSGTFDNFNSYATRGDSSRGSRALNDTLMVSSDDDLFGYYPLIAKKISYASDYSFITFYIDEKATFSDGKPIRPEDIKFSFNKLIEEGLPGLKAYYGYVEKVEVLDDNRVQFTLKEGERSRQKILQLCGLTVFPEHFWKDHRLDEPLKVVPVSSSAYIISDFEFGKFEVIKRLDNYWAKDNPARVGLLTLDEIKLDYYRDQTVAFEAFKAGKIDVWVENTAKRWASDYTFPAIKDGRVLKLEVPHQIPLRTQGFVFNINRPPFTDLKVRKALTYLMDFEWMNKNLFYGQYVRADSFFGNTEYKATGLPSEGELEFLNQIKDKIPASVFTEEFKLPVTDGNGNMRKNLRAALRLFKEAGWVVKDQKLVNAETGKQFEFEMLLVSPTMEKIALAFNKNLKKAGIKMDIRTVDSSQYQDRVTNYDYDVISSSYQNYPYPNALLWRQWHSDNLKSSWNRNGIDDPTIDWLMEEVLKYQEDKDADKLLALGHAIDRVLMHNYYLIPQWNISKFRIAHWDKFGKPAKTPKYSLGNGDDAGEYTSWWFDAAKADALNK